MWMMVWRRLREKAAFQGHDRVGSATDGCGKQIHAVVRGRKADGTGCRLDHSKDAQVRRVLVVEVGGQPPRRFAPPLFWRGMRTGPEVTGEEGFR